MLKHHDKGDPSPLFQLVDLILRQIQSRGYETKQSILKIPKAWAFQAGINEDEFKKIIGSINHFHSEPILSYMNWRFEERVKFQHSGLLNEFRTNHDSYYFLSEKGLEKQDLENHFLLEIQTDYLTKKLQAIINKSARKKINKGKQIVSLTLVNLNPQKYKIVVNEQYLEPIEVARHANNTWDLLFRLAEGEKILYKKIYKSAIDYLNSNGECKLYSNTNCVLTEILGRENELLGIKINHEILTTKAFETRKNKLA